MILKTKDGYKLEVTDSRIITSITFPNGIIIGFGIPRHKRTKEDGLLLGFDYALLLGHWDVVISPLGSYKITDTYSLVTTLINAIIRSLEMKYACESNIYMHRIIDISGKQRVIYEEALLKIEEYKPQRMEAYSNVSPTKGKRYKTPLGKHLMKIRVDREITQKQMSRALNISVVRLAAIERGDISIRVITADTIEAIDRIYCDPHTPSHAYRNYLEHLASLNTPVLTIDMRDADENQRDMMHVLNKHYKSLGSTTITKIRNIIGVDTFIAESVGWNDLHTALMPAVLAGESPSCS